MKQLLVQMVGGLGNQLFQYAAARAISLDRGLTLVLDTESGYVRDRQYKRRYELGAFPISVSIASWPMRLRLWLFRLRIKFVPHKKQAHYSTFYGDFYVETSLVFDEQLPALPFASQTWLLGYWQSPRYFAHHKDVLQAELKPQSPKDVKFLDVGATMRCSESVALGIRLYEESSDPSAHALGGKIKKRDDINGVIKLLLSERPNAQFFVFCTHHSSGLEKLNLPTGTLFITPDEGYVDTLDCLWLLTQCKHHIFTNSSYYWWGAWLSHETYKREEQLIYAADNFINVDGLCDHWKRF